MQFIILEIVFAAIALALVVVVVLIVRQLRRDRHAKRDAMPREAKPTPEAIAPRPRAFGLGRKTAETEPEPGPPPVRKRQLRTLSEIERDAADEMPEQVEAEPADDGADFGPGVLARLEAAFERYQANEIALDDYTALVLAERGAVDRRIAALNPAGASAELDEALKAQESVRWCLKWAEEQRTGEGQSDRCQE
jgi:hypothetical protein